MKFKIKKNGNVVKEFETKKEYNTSWRIKISKGETGYLDLTTKKEETTFADFYINIHGKKYYVREREGTPYVFEQNATYERDFHKGYWKTFEFEIPIDVRDRQYGENVYIGINGNLYLQTLLDLGGSQTNKNWVHEGTFNNLKYRRWDDTEGNPVRPQPLSEPPDVDISNPDKLKATSEIWYVNNKYRNNIENSAYGWHFYEHGRYDDNYSWIYSRAWPEVGAGYGSWTVRVCVKYGTESTKFKIETRLGFTGDNWRERGAAQKWIKVGILVV